MGSLLLTTMPRQDETFTSFLLRTCQEYEYESLSWITNLIGIDIRQLAKPNPHKFNLEPLAQLLRIDESVLWSLTFHNDIKFFERALVVLKITQILNMIKFVQFVLKGIHM